MSNYNFKKLSFKEISSILDKCSICVLGMADANFPYLIPMYFEYDDSQNEPFFILESKEIGQKMRYLANNSKVCVFVQYNEPEAYKSIVASGKAFVCENSNEESVSNLVNIKIKIKEITGRIYYK